MAETFDQTLNKEIGRRIGQYREDNGINQETLAKQIGVSRSTLSLIENGSQAPNFAQLVKIGMLTGIDFGDLLNPQQEVHIVVDTNVILHRLQSLAYLAGVCDHLHVPQVVVTEINYQKDRSRQQPKKKTASRAEQEIIDLKEKGLLQLEPMPSGSFHNNDDVIYGVAEAIARTYTTDMVYLLTNDKDFKLKGEAGRSNLRVINTDEFDEIFRQDDGWNVKESQLFFKAVKAGDREAALEHAKKHADVNYIDQATGRTPLHQAIENGDGRMIEFLLRLPRIDINAVDRGKYEIPPISRAIQKRQRKVVEYLIAMGANVDEPSSNNVKNPYNTPLMIAAWQGSLDLVKLLVENGACINQQDKGNGFTALIKAVYKCNPDVVRYLLDCHADTTIHSFEKKTAYDYACERCHGPQGEEIKRMLVQDVEG